MPFPLRAQYTSTLTLKKVELFLCKKKKHVACDCIWHHCPFPSLPAKNAPHIRIPLFLCFCSFAGVLEEAHLSVIYILAADRPSPLPAVRCPNVGGQRGGRSACNWKWPLAGFPCQALSLSVNWHNEYPEYTAASVD